ncbi:MAG: hypothetical protein ACI9O4_000832 [Chitinophagales bacterium]|jgi:hypothetical protein
MMVLVEKLRQADFVLSTSLKTYVRAISKNIWFKHMRDKKKNASTELSDLHSNGFMEESTLVIEV